MARKKVNRSKKVHPCRVVLEDCMMKMKVKPEGINESLDISNLEKVDQINHCDSIIEHKTVSTSNVQVMKSDKNLLNDLDCELDNNSSVPVLVEPIIVIDSSLELEENNPVVCDDPSKSAANKEIVNEEQCDTAESLNQEKKVFNIYEACWQYCKGNGKTRWNSIEKTIAAKYFGDYITGKTSNAPLCEIRKMLIKNSEHFLDRNEKSVKTWLYIQRKRKLARNKDKGQHRRLSHDKENVNSEENVIAQSSHLINKTCNDDDSLNHAKKSNEETVEVLQSRDENSRMNITPDDEYWNVGPRPYKPRRSAWTEKIGWTEKEVYIAEKYFGDYLDRKVKTTSVDRIRRMLRKHPQHFMNRNEKSVKTWLYSERKRRVQELVHQRLVLSQMHYMDSMK